MDTITEGKATIYMYKGKISKELPVFYNPVMQLNRDVSIEVINKSKSKHVALPLSGTGIRGIRILKECNVETLTMNDHSEEAVLLIKDNLKLNKVKADVENKDANLFLLESRGFDYIDIDPFGYPGPFLDSAVKRIARNGILAVTATDTSALSGTFPNACRRKYGIKPLKDSNMHENGLRILIKFCQNFGMMYDKALIPILSYSKDHYMRVFFRCEKGKEKCNELLKQQRQWWEGQLWDKTFLKGIKNEFVQQLYEESLIDVNGFYLIHDICKKEKLDVPKFDVLMKKIKNKGYKVSRTHFDLRGLRSDIGYDELVKLIQS
ncbi:tRNA (guanine(26)-N(2))-dimethyltransferase [Candidatus Woesearchaeota archaeon]|nr:tRNA (guanine(26)-N(2))-dimethyltransferase [Candidatus Woesearchaeota archaeon]